MSFASMRFLQTMDDGIYSKLDKLAKRRGITVQDLIRGVIVPDWLEKKE